MQKNVSHCETRFLYMLQALIQTERRYYMFLPMTIIGLVKVSVRAGLA